jgi:hypothetical protein
MNRTAVSDLPIDILEVSSRRDLDLFIRVPWGIYADDPNWIPPLVVERKGALSDKHPFFEHASWQGFVAMSAGKPVGRISAQIDELYLQRHDSQAGFFGMYEAVDDDRVAAALFSAAERWLAARGMRRMVGPFSLGINQEIGILVEGFDSPPSIMMAHGRPYYDAQLTRAGFEKATDVLAYWVASDDFHTPRLIRALLKRQGQRVRVRSLDKSNVDRDLELLRDIFNDAWQNNWGFVPFTEREFSALGKELLMLVPREFIHIAEVDGQPAAFSVLLPNINEAIADLNGRLAPLGWAKLLWRLKVRFPESARVPLMGVRQQFQNTRLGPALAFLVIEALLKPALARGVRGAELSWILEDNKGMRNIIEQVGGSVTKRYRMYARELDR